MPATEKKGISVENQTDTAHTLEAPQQSPSVSDQPVDSPEMPSRADQFMVAAAKELFRLTVAVGIAVFVILHWFYKPVVTVDLKELVALEKEQVRTLKAEEAETAVAEYFKRLSERLQSNNSEIILVKEAVINSDRVPNVTGRYKPQPADPAQPSSQKP